MFILAFKSKTFHLFLPNLILFVTKYIKIKEQVKEESSHVLKIFLSITRAKRFSFSLGNLIPDIEYECHFPESITSLRGITFKTTIILHQISGAL